MGAIRPQPEVLRRLSPAPSGDPSVPQVAASTRALHRQGMFARGTYAPGLATQPTFYPTDHYIAGGLLHSAPCYSGPLGPTLTPPLPSTSRDPAACPCTTTKQRTPRPVCRGHQHSGPRSLLPVHPSATPSRPTYYMSIGTSDLHKPLGTGRPTDSAWPIRGEA